MVLAGELWFPIAQISVNGLIAENIYGARVTIVLFSVIHSKNDSLI
jgi:hypothetical protein